MADLAIGIDIGGTKIAGALVTRSGKIRTRVEYPTPASEGGRAVIARAAEIADELLKASPREVEGIGVAAAGQIDPKTGVVIQATELLPDWKGTPITSILEERFGIPARAINDASGAALGEGKFGAARGVRDFVCITIGTGVGGGIVSEGKLLPGALGVAGSIGHMTIDCDGRPCNCGSVGCLEAYVAGTAIVNRILELADACGIRSPLVDGLRSKELTGARALNEAVHDELALEVIREAGEYLGWGIVNLLNLLNPAMVVIGGSVVVLGDLLLDPARRIASQRSLRGESDPVRIVRAELGNDAGVIGAASLIWEERDPGV